MVKAVPCRNEVKAWSAYPHQRESVYPGTGHCRRWKFSFLLASGQSWASRNFNRLSGVTIRWVSIRCRSLELLPPRPSTVMSASHTQFSCVRNSRFESAWSGCYKNHADFPGWPAVFRSYVWQDGSPTAGYSPIWPRGSTLTTGVSWFVHRVQRAFSTSGVQLEVAFKPDTQGPSSANHVPFHLPCRKI